MSQQEKTIVVDRNGAHVRRSMPKKAVLLTVLVLLVALFFIFGGMNLLDAGLSDNTNSSVDATSTSSPVQ